MTSNNINNKNNSNNNNNNNNNNDYDDDDNSYSTKNHPKWPLLILKVYEFTVVARDGGKVPFEGHAKVIVTLIDVNDNAPVFKQGDYQVFNCINVLRANAEEH